MSTAKVLLYIFFGTYTAWLILLCGLFYLSYATPEPKGENWIVNLPLSIVLITAVKTYAPVAQGLITALHSFTNRRYILGGIFLALAITTVVYMETSEYGLLFAAAVWPLSTLVMAAEMLFHRKRTHNKRIHQTPSCTADTRRYVHDMKHNYKNSTDENAGEQLRQRLETETVADLMSSYGDVEATKAAIFLFVNRAFESQMPESQIAELFGRCIVRAGFREEDEEPAFAWLETFAHVARGVYGST
ncbi:MAG: hypothetical protein QGH60_14000 [Phycisphaerae bacterium]|jgi:hypothetical protein|nr:hypothetical protein [Phycisphaerae bacterium]